MNGHHRNHPDQANRTYHPGRSQPSKLLLRKVQYMGSDEVVIRLSHDEALVLFEWLTRTDDATDGFANLVEDQAEQRALWNLASLLERLLVEPLAAEYQDLVAKARSRLRDRD
jgi:hypothetical protein